MTLAPRIEGTLSIRSSPARFSQAVRERVAARRLLGPADPRSNYVLVPSPPDRLRLHAVGWPTAISVGLNELELRLSNAGSIAYEVRYWRWSAYALGLCGGLGIVGLVLLVGFDVRSYIAGHPSAQTPGLSVDQSVGIAWAMVLFWGFVWPWLLIVLHKRPLHRLVARIVAEVDDVGSGTSRLS